MNWRTIPYDLKQLKGDPMLLISLTVPFILWVLMYPVYPIVEQAVLKQWNLDISPYYPQAGIFLVMLIPMMMGMVYGFILLDERDAGVITAISVTPTGKSGYLVLRMGIPMVLSFVLIMLYLILLRLSGSLNLLQLILISMVMSGQSLILLLILGAYADNKVMGMAITKGSGLLLIGPLLDYVLPAPYNWVGAFSPLFWASRTLLAETPGFIWFYAGITFLFHLLVIWFLFRKFKARSD